MLFFFLIMDSESTHSMIILMGFTEKRVHLEASQNEIMFGILREDNKDHLAFAVTCWVTNAGILS